MLAMITPVLDRYLGDRRPTRLGAMDDVTVLKLDGGHHVHMDQPELLVDALRRFLIEADLEHD